jgi:hypothetical protein
MTRIAGVAGISLHDDDPWRVAGDARTDLLMELETSTAIYGGTPPRYRSNVRASLRRSPVKRELAAHRHMAA